MKIRMRILSIAICLALLISSVPADLWTVAGHAARAEEVAIEAEAAAPEEEAPPTEAAAPEQAEEEAAPEAEGAEPDGSDAPEAEAAEPEAPAQDAPEIEGAEDGPAVSQDAPVDYGADASASPDFVRGYAAVIRRATPAYASEAADAPVVAKLDKGAVYAVGRTAEGADPDRIAILYNAGSESGADAAWVDASALRPMDPAQEVAAYAGRCADQEGVIYPEELAGLPLARISCAYPEADEAEADSAPAEEAQPEQGHPLVRYEAPEGDISTMPLPLEDAVLRVEEALPEEQAEASAEIQAFDAMPVFTLQADTLYLGLGESFDLSETGFVACTADDGEKIKLIYAVTEGDCVTFITPGVLMATGIGEAYVTITEENSAANCRLKVVTRAVAKGVSVRDRLTLSLGMTANLDVRFTPENTYSGYRLSCDPEGVVELLPNGRIAAAAPGKTTVTLRTNGGLVDTCYVTVTSDSVTIQAPESVSMALGEEDRRIEAVALVGEEEVSCDFTYAVVEGEQVVRVDAATGALTALNLGSATVSISTPGAEPVECAVNVLTAPKDIWLRTETLRLGVGETYQISDEEGGIIQLSPGSYVASYGYSFYNSSIIDVSESGRITAKSAGTTTITIIPSSDNAELYLEVVVMKPASSIRLSKGEIELTPNRKSDTIEVSFGAGTCSSYTLGFSEYESGDGEGEDEENGAPVAISRGEGDTWTLSVPGEIESGEILTLVARAASGAKDFCIVRLLPGPDSEQINVELSKTVLGMGETGMAVASIADGELAASEFTYSARPEGVVTVDDAGIITAHVPSGADGVVIVATATVPGPEGYASAESEPITVVSYPTKLGFAPGKETLRLGLGDSYALRLGEEDADPDDIMDISPSDARTSYTYSSSNANIASVTDDGVIVAKKAGKAQITIHPENSAPGVANAKLQVEVLKSATSVELSQGSMRIGVDMAAEPLTVRFPENTYSRYVATSSNPDVLRVSQSGETIHLEPVSAGKATVRVQTETAGSDSCLVEVVDETTRVTLSAPAIIGVGETGGKITAILADDSLSAAVSFQSNNTAALEVDPSSGALNPKGVGIAAVSAYLNYKGDGQDVAVASAKIEVVPAPTTIVLDPASIRLRVDELYQITSEGAAPMIGVNAGSHGSFTYTSDNQAIATVSETGLIKGVKKGTCQIVITAQNGTTKAYLNVAVDKDFSIKASQTTLGVGMSADLSATDAPKDASVVYSCEPEGALEFSGSRFKAVEAGTVTLTARAGEGESAKLSNAVVLTVLPAPGSGQILFTSESATRVSPYQQNVKVSAVCAPGTMAELGYRLGAGAPSGVSVDRTTGALSVNARSGSFVVEAYDRNNDTSAEHVVAIVNSGEFAGLRADSIRLKVHETYQLSDGPDGIIEVSVPNATGSYKFTSNKKKVATVSAGGLITAVKAGSAKIRIASTANKKNSKDLTVTVTAADEAVSINPGMLTLGVGMTGKLSLSSATLKLESDDEGIATVDAFGNVTAVAEGDATITARNLSGGVDTALVHVVATPIGVELECDDITMGKGDKNVKLSASIVSAPGSEPAGTIEYVLADSADKKYLTVNAVTGAMTAKKKTKEDEPVTVYARIKEFPGVRAAADVTIVSKTSVSLTTKTVQLGVGDTYQLRDYIPEDDEEEYALDDEDDEEEENGIVKLTPEEARDTTVFSYKSSKSSVATVSSEGLITAKATGTAKITISTQSNRSAKLTVKVLKLPDSVSLDKTYLQLGEGMTHVLKPSFKSGTYARCSFSSSSEDVASVDRSGKITANAEGMAVITARTSNGKTASCRVLVVPATQEIYITAVRGARKISLSDGDSLSIGVGEKNVKLIAEPDEGSLAEFSFALANKSDKKKLTVNKTTGALSAKKVTDDDPVDVVITEKNSELEATISVEILKKPKSKANLTLSPSSITLCKGETFQIAEQSDEYENGIIQLDEDYGASYSFKSKDSSVASVNSDGLVTAKKDSGKTTIRISTQNSSVYKDLTVTVAAKPDSLRIDPLMRIGSGMTIKFAPVYSPANAFSNLQVTSSDESLLQAEFDPETGNIVLTAATVTARASATIDVRAPGSGLSDTSYVTILPAPQNDGVDFDYEHMPAAVKENGEWIVRVGVNEKGARLVARCTDSGAMSDFSFSGPSSGLTVDSATGELTAKTIGKYTVYAASKNNPSARASATVEVVKGPDAIYFHASDAKPKETELAIQLGVGGTYQIAEYRKNELTGAESGILVLDPANSSASYTYAASAKKNSTASTSVIGIDKSSGLITAKQEGTAYVKITSQNSKSRILTVNVVRTPDSVYLDPATQSVGENSTGSVTLKFVPEDSADPVASYVSSDSAVLRIDGEGRFTTGDLRETGASETVTITVTTQSGLSASAKVVVLPHPSAVSFAEPVYRLTAGMQLSTAPGAFPAGQMASKFRYESEDPQTATIDAQTGVLTGVREGTTTITITANPGKSYEVSGTAQVVVDPAPARISYADMGLPDVLKIAKGDVVAFPEPKAYTASGEETRANFRYSLKTASDKSFLTIEGNEMTAVKASDKDIVVTVAAHNSTASKPVETELKVRVYDESPTSIELYYGERKVNGATLWMYVNKQHPEDSIALTSKISGSNVNYGGLEFEISGSPSVTVSAKGEISVRGDADGRVPDGTTAVIVAKAKKGGATASCTVQVGELCDQPTLRKAALSMQEGMQERIDIACVPSTAGMRMRYTSQNEKVAAVDAEGIVTAVGGGETEIRIEGQYGWSETVSVSVLYNPDDIQLPVRKLYMQPGEHVTITPTLSKRGIAAEKVNVFTRAASSYDGVVRVEQIAEADQSSGAAASYEISAVTGGTQRVTFTTCNGIEAACDVEVKEGGWAEDPSGFGWDESASLYIIKGDTAPIEYGLSTSAFNQGGGFAVSPAPGSENLIEVREDGSIQALEVGRATLQLNVGDQAPRSVQIEVINPVAPKMWYGDGELLDLPVQSEVKLNIGFEGVDPGDHTIRIEKLPAPYSPDSILLGTYDIIVEDEALLEIDRAADRIHSKDIAGKTKVTVKTYGSEISTIVTVLPATTYRALLISEWNGTGGGSVLPFAQQNIDWMASALGESSIDGARYDVTIAERNATRDQIKSAIQSTFADTQPNDVSLVFIVAHGHKNGSTGYKFSGPNGIEVTASDLMTWLHSYIQGKVILILDSCHSGGFIDSQKSQLDNFGNIAVLAAQERARGAAYYVEYKGISTFEFFTRALVTGLGYPKPVGDSDPWGNQTPSADANRDGRYTVQEIFDTTMSVTEDMVNKYAIPGTAGSAWWNAGNGGLMVGGISKSASDMTKWFNQGKQIPQDYIPGDMANLVLFAK